MKRLRLLASLAVIAVAIAGAACNKETARSAMAATGRSGARALKVGFVSNNADPCWTLAEAGTTKAAKDFEVDVLFRRPQRSTPSEQTAIINDLLNQGVEAIALSVSNPKIQHAFLDEIATKVPLITQDTDAPASKRIRFIGTDHYQAGRAAGRLVKEVLPDGGTLAIFMGVPESLNGQRYRRGLLEELAGQRIAAETNNQFGKYTLHNTFYDYADTEKTRKQAEVALGELGAEAHVCFIGVGSDTTPVVVGAVKRAAPAVKVQIIGFGAAADTLRGVRDGDVHATVVQNYFEFGYQSVKLMAALTRGDHAALPAGPQVVVPFRVLRQGDVQEFLADLRKILGKGAAVCP